MKDRELLELAAKAAGIEIRRGSGYQADMLFRQVEDSSGIVTGVEWNPLIDDGDALRLAARLNFRIDIQGGTVRIVDGLDNEHYLSGVATNQEDQMKVVRRAIVRAAAAIGETK